MFTPSRKGLLSFVKPQTLTTDEKTQGRTNLFGTFPANRILGNAQGVDAVPTAITPAQVRNSLGVQAFFAPSIVLQFDDGYEDNRNALNLAIKHGVPLLMYVDVLKINGTQFGQQAATIGLLRDWIDAGCEIAMHHSVNISVTTTYEAACIAEKQLLRDLITGLRSIAAGGVITTNPAMTHPQYALWEPVSVSYQGGTRTDATDRVMRHLYKWVRVIPGSIALRGDVLAMQSATSEKTIVTSGTVADTFVDGAAVPLVPVHRTLSTIHSIARTGLRAFLYFHGSPISMPANQASYQAPFILASELEQVIVECKANNVQIVTHQQMSSGNLYRDFDFRNSQGTFNTNSGDSAGFVTGPELPYMTAPRFVRLTATAFRSNTNTQWICQPFFVKPFCRYIVRVMYRMSADLVLNGGAGNWNHGLEFILQTFQGNTANDSAGAHRYASVNCQNDRPWAPVQRRLPYLSNGGGWQEFVDEFISLQGTQCTLICALFNGIGTVDIGQLFVEEGESLDQRAFGGQNTFDTSLGRIVGLPTSNPGGSGRRWDWTVDVDAPVVTTTTGAADIGMASKQSDGLWRVRNNVNTRSDSFWWTATPRRVP